jgi:hypothetical protein
MARTPANQRSIYQLRILLRDSRPSIFRRVEVTADTTLHKLHWVVQLAMGWTNSHLHQFIIGNLRYSQPEFDEGELGTLDECTVRLRDVVWEPRSVFVYEYDFGDSWEHDILVEGIYPRQPDQRYPRCIEGKRACPPEDCGGIDGYRRLRKAIRDPGHGEHDEYLTWLGGSFDPDAFDLKAVNDSLRRLWNRHSLDHAR